MARRRLHTAVWKLRNLLASGRDEGGRRLISWSAPGYVLEVLEEQLDWARFNRLRAAGEAALQRGAARLAESYLSAALTLWEGTEPLTGIDVPVDDIGFVAEQKAGRERTVASLTEARLQLGAFGQLIPELEARITMDPTDGQATAQLAVAHYQSENPGRALEVCRRYMEMVTAAGGEPSERVANLQTAILRHDVDAGRQPVTGGDMSPAGHPAVVAAAWAPYAPSAAAVLPAEIHLLAENAGAELSEANESSLEAAFADLRSALVAAVDIQQAVGLPPLARIAIDVRVSQLPSAGFEGLRTARARLLAAAAREGQILVSGADSAAIQPALPPAATLRPLGNHRLNNLTPPAAIFQLRAPGIPEVPEAPRWFDRGPVRNLAEEPFRMVGRDEEIVAVTRRFTTGRFVTLVGAPGSGKTRLASHVATGLSGEYRDGVWFIGLESISGPGLVAATVADILGIPQGGPLPPAEILFRQMRHRHALLVLDNCEHLLGECRDLVEGLLAACPEVAVLATSREAFRSRVEQVVPVPPLAPPALDSPDVVLANAAVQLFYDRLGVAAESAQRRPAAEVRAVARICRAVEAIPLALVFAAGRARELGTEPLADLLEEELGEGRGLRILSGGGASTTTRKTLEGTMEWSYRLLRQEDRRLFETLAVFRAPFSVESAIAICADADRVSREGVTTGMQRLVEASVVSRHDDHGRNRFRLLQPVRDFASAKFALRDHAATVHRRHAAHFLTVAEEAENRVRGAQDVATLDRLEADLPDLYAAIQWTITHNEPTMALRVVGCLWVFWLVRGRIAEGCRMIESALAADRSISSERAKALIACSHLSWFGGDLKRAREVLHEALGISEAIADRWGWAWATLGLAAVEMFNPADDTVALRIEEVLPEFRKLGNDWDTGQAIQTLGGAAWHRGQYERAEQALSESVALYRSLGHPTLMASLLAHGLMLAVLGQLDAGAAEADHSVVTAYEAGDVAILSWALCHRAAIARYAGHHDQARRYYRDALRAARDAGNGWGIQWALDGLGDTEQLGLHLSEKRLHRSVMLLAGAEVLSELTGIVLAPREREYHARDLDRARSRLGEPAFTAAFEHGKRLSVDETIALGLTPVDTAFATR